MMVTAALLLALASPCPPLLGMAAWGPACHPPRDTLAMSQWLAERAPPAVLPEDLVAAATVIEGGPPGQTARVLDGRVSESEALVVVEKRVGPGDCAGRWSALMAFRREERGWIKTGAALNLDSWIPMRCLAPPGPEVSASCEVQWDGGYENDHRPQYPCPEGAVRVPLRGNARCLRVTTCEDVVERH